MSNPIFWLSLPTHEGWGLVTIDDRRVGLLYTHDLKGQTEVRIAGYHYGETKWVGEQKNILTVKLEKIPENFQKGMVEKIRNILPSELSTCIITFLDVSYLIKDG